MRKVLKWTGILLGGLVLLLVVAGGAFYLIGSSKASKTHEVQPASLTISSDSASLAKGAHLAGIHGCVDCHGENLAGQVFVDAPPFLVTAANLTSGKGGLGSTYSAADFDRSLRHGVSKDGRALFIMPSAAFHQMADSDAAALIAYIQSVPPVDNELPKTELRVPGLMMAAVALDPDFEVRTGPARSEDPPPVGTAAYGEYITSITCSYCHGADLRGAQPPMPDSPIAPDLAAAGQWTLDQFKTALRTGVRPGREPLNQEYMPYQFTARMTDAELESLHAHLATLVETGAN